MLFRWLIALGSALAAAGMRADGIAVSTDGLIWTKGAGGYGDGWNTGTGVNVRQGGTLYIKYYSDEGDIALSFSEHGRKAEGAWRAIGPVLSDGLGAHAQDPVILRISDAGTSKSTVAWINGNGKSGIWSGLQAPGPYDLALHNEARWTLPPIVITEELKSPSFWSRFLGRPNTSRPSREVIRSVPEDGTTALLLAIALLSLAIAHRKSR